MIGSVQSLLEHRAKETMSPGDMFLANDPYTGGGSHLPDLNVLAPVFHDGHIVAFVANIAHHADVGGMVPGSESAACESIFQEGLRLPPVRLVAAGEVCEDIVNIVLLNSRVPHERAGDLRAQIASNRTAVRGVSRLFERFGSDTVRASLEQYLSLTEMRFRQAIDRLPDGSFEACERLAGDAPGEFVTLAVRLTVDGGRMVFDFEGTMAALNSARNIPYQATVATVYTVAKALLDPDVPANEGYFRSIEVRTPPGSIVCPQPPAAVGCRSISCGVLSDLLIGVLGAADPKVAMAGSGPHHLMTWSGIDPRNGEYFVNYETVAGGLGAFRDADGLAAVRTLASGSANLPVEALEHAYPLRVERYALREGSGGAGRFRGGAGIVRDYRVLGEAVKVNLSAERLHAPAPGMAGGEPATCGRFVVEPGTEREREYDSGTSSLALDKGTLFRVETPGGGGFGGPNDESASE